MKHEDTEIAKTILDALSVATVVATLVEMLPSIAALFTIFWTGIRIWESQTIGRLVGRKSSNAVDE